jgi:hypothetical protein
MSDAEVTRDVVDELLGITITVDGDLVLVP